MTPTTVDVVEGEAVHAFFSAFGAEFAEADKESVSVTLTDDNSESVSITWDDQESGWVYPVNEECDVQISSVTDTEDGIEVALVSSVEDITFTYSDAVDRVYYYPED